MDVPRAFVVKGLPPATKLDKACGAKDCLLLRSQHTGSTCAICRDPIEHHGRPPFAQRCLAGAQRMAAAREAASQPLSEIDRRVLSMARVP